MTTTKYSTVLSVVAIVAALLAASALAALHFLSPEFAPSWRMVSEYAKGSYGAVLSLMFALWATSSFALAGAIATQVDSVAAKIGVAILVVSGIGAGLGGVFDITHPLHSLAAMIGIPNLPIAAMLISINLSRSDAWKPAKKSLLISANATWISFVLMGVSFALLMATFMQSGAKMEPGIEPTTLPDGVIGIVGWANRLLIVAYLIWTITAATNLLRLSRGH